MGSRPDDLSGEDWAEVGGGAPGEACADDLLAGFARWAADQRALEAAHSRREVASLREQAAGSATLTGTLVDLAEREARVAVQGPNLSLAGRVVGVGQDFFTLSPAGGGLTLVAHRAVSTVRPEERAQGTGVGDRGAPLSLDMAAALAWLAAEGSRVRLVLAGGERLEGGLVSVGVDVLTLRVGSGGGRQLVLVPVAAVEACTAT